MKARYTFQLLMIISGLMFSSACDKSGFLDEKPNQRLVVPGTAEELQAILDNDFEMNGIPGGIGLVPNLGEIGADNYYVPDGIFKTTFTNPLYRSYYQWDPDVTTMEPVRDWDRPYLCILYANVVLDALSRWNNKQDSRYSQLMGAALFFRAHAFYQLAQVFAPPYDPLDANEGLGIPLRLTADINEKLYRASVQETYQQIINDLIIAVRHLPLESGLTERPTRQAAYGLLARVFLTTMDYAGAYSYADSCLQLNGKLFDYNNVDGSQSYTFRNSGVLETEVLFSSTMIGQDSQLPISTVYARIDTVLYGSYADGDLRKTLFYGSGPANDYYYRGSYYGHAHNFAGIALDEIYLIRAEGAARNGELEAAIRDLNMLLRARWDNDVEFEPYTGDNAEAVLALVKQERRKELVFRGHRWTDLRRYNMEGDRVEPARRIDGVVFQLAPNDPRYVYPIPLRVLGFNDGMRQNERF